MADETPIPPVPEAFYIEMKRARYDLAEADVVSLINRVWPVAVAEGIRIGRETAAAAIVAHADRTAPMETHRVPSQKRRSLMTAAQVASNPATPEQIAEAIKSLARPVIAAVCHLDDAGRAVSPREQLDALIPTDVLRSLERMEVEGRG